MNVRICCPNNEYQLLLSLTYGVWGKKANSLKSWEIDDQIIFAIKNGQNENCAAALARISGTPFYDEQHDIWISDIPGSKDKYPYRVKIEPLAYFPVYDRLRIKDQLLNIENWGLLLRDQKPIDSLRAECLLESLSECENRLDDFNNNTHRYLSDFWEKNRSGTSNFFGQSNPHPQESEELTNPNPKCPICNSLKTHRIVYGLPPANIEPHKQEKFTYRGGCSPSQEKWHCPDCENSW